ncbi:ABC transporter ATP-binding protein/permease [Streptomyces scopuliridis]|uniref:ABC transporter ATP-binding protein/permease n=1 Tax=Streptomyces scopuliridis TaxID=452529 RepID=A0ACD4ZEX2_9ACTN|nr:ABC transporter ATP-binding protein [Streptomyces scopuliridis]WSB97014.1 ABC transporter ATP-binding protein/permease [Streptomyces scopuliridis]WSC09282.1 ABC transporter ATP-binding protein/permease [Streptomyces scopuliridis]
MGDSYVHPGIPDRRSAARYLWWLVTSQRGRVAAGATWGSVWMIGLTLPPYLLSRAIDDGLEPGNRAAFLGWVGALFGVGVANAWVGMMRHRTMTRVRHDAAFRTVRVVVRQATRLGATLPRRVTAGEVVTIGISDVIAMSRTLTITGPGFGAVVAYLVVAALLLSVSSLLAAVVLLGVPLLAVLVGPLLGRLQRVETTYRERQGALAARFVDIVGGLRVLSGLGGKDVYAGRYRRDSAKLKEEGYRVGAVTSWIDALGLGLPALFLAAVTWLAARMAAQGDITVGELVAVYGYVAVLVVPVAFFIEGGYDLSRGLVCARRVIRFLDLEPEFADSEQQLKSAVEDGPSSPAPLSDPASGVSVEPGTLTALVCARPSDATRVADRLGRFVPSDATWGGVRLDAFALPRIRERVLVADNEADLFAGTLREAVEGRRERDEEAIAEAVRAAVAQDIVDGRRHGLDSRILAGGRDLSGGQRQRVRLIRALLADPEVLIAVDPTSAVDAHTEAALAARLRTARAGRTTLVTTTSPLMLERADTVHYLVDGSVAATGSHRELIRDQAGYRALVSRGAEDELGAEGRGMDLGHMDLGHMDLGHMDEGHMDKRRMDGSRTNEPGPYEEEAAR